MLELGHSLDFADLYSRDGLERLDDAFLKFLGSRDEALQARLRSGRKDPEALEALEESELVMEAAPHLEAFLGELFGIGDALAGLRGEHAVLEPLFAVRRNFVQRRAIKKIKADKAVALDGEMLTAAVEKLIGGELTELAFANKIAEWEADAEANTEKLEICEAYAAWATLAPAGQVKHGGGALFREPHKLDPEHLVPHMQSDDSSGFTGHTMAEDHQRHREGFALTDEGIDLAGALGEANYCIWCHKQGRDSCSTGLREKKSPDQARQPPFRKSPFGVTLAGCPLEEKISEFQKVKADGWPVGALAIAVIDNPMVAATGHRICNDCMKSCVYQKQDPVDIPQVETRTLNDVLALPWGFEIYSLLTRWNPLNLHRSTPKPDSGRRVLIVGMGPAGFTLAHHLMNDGHTVAAIDGLKIEPLPEAVSGVSPLGERVEFEPVEDVNDLYESLDDRVMAGFGGVAEYGITVRWNKNYLKLIRLLLERRAQFAMFGGVRFGGTVTLEDAWEMGFDHVALCLGAGRPTVIDIPNNLARGVRTASDFLMALQLTGAARKDSIANMQLRLPVVVIGGGLTAIDTATEALAYYPRQVEKFLTRFDTLCAEHGEAEIVGAWDDEEKAIANQFLIHARTIRDERIDAEVERRPPRLAALVRSWGGVTIAYRKRLIDAPSYTLNHEEVTKALEEGIGFAECLSPVAIDVDENGHASAIRLTRQTLGDDGKWQSGEEITLPARGIFMAAGTHPNTVLAREDADHFTMDGRYFQACDETGTPISPQKSAAKPDAVRVLMSRNEDGRFVSFFGDLHPSYFGNVVKAMGSAKQGYPVVSEVLESVEPADSGGTAQFLATLNNGFRPVIDRVERLTPNIVEVVVKAPAAAWRFRPGQFYRLQNFEANAVRAADTTLAMEGLALTGAWVEPSAGLISVIVLEMGGSSNLCQLLKPGEPVILMGPTGMPTETPPGETVLLAGGGLGNAVLFSIGQAFRAAGSKVLYFAGYKAMRDRYKIEEIEAAADVIVWSCDEEPGFEPDRPQDRSTVDNIVETMRAYAAGELGEQVIPFGDVDRIVVIGSDRMMAAVAAARHSVLKPYLKDNVVGIGSINSPMQCMMKEVCAQCLQPHIDPDTGERSHVFSCFNQDQLLDTVDWPGLNSRLRQNTVQEKLTARWIAHCMKEAAADAKAAEAAEE